MATFVNASSVQATNKTFTMITTSQASRPAEYRSTSIHNSDNNNPPTNPGATLLSQIEDPQQNLDEGEMTDNKATCQTCEIAPLEALFSLKQYPMLTTMSRIQILHSLSSSMSGRAS